MFKVKGDRMLKVCIAGEEFLFDVEQGTNAGSGSFQVVQNRGKAKTLIAVDTEKVNSIAECVDKIVTENRLNQGIEHLKMNGLEVIPQNLGTFIKWVTSDAIREELDTIVESGLEPKEVGGAIAKYAREWFLKNNLSVSIL